MADEKSFSQALEALDEESEATGRNENNNDNAEHSNPETNGHVDINSSFHSNRNVSTTSSEQFQIPSYGSGHGISASPSIARAQPSRFGASEESRTSSSQVPIAAPRGIVHRTDQTHSNRPSQSCFKGRIWRPWSEMEPQNASFGSDINRCREEENNASNFFSVQKLTSPEVPIERQESGAVRQTTQDDRQLSGTSAVLPAIEDVSSMEGATDRASVASLTGAKASAQVFPSGCSSRIEISPESSALVSGSSSDASAVSVAGPSGTQAQSKKPEKEGPFVCDVCCKAFTYRSHFEAHYRTHTGAKPFECGVCGKRFAQQGNLTKHLLTHTGERRFSCEVCGKGFNRKESLQIHLRTHTGEMPYVCEICGRGFSRKHHLEDHLRTHSGEKPFTCKWCGWQFSDPSSYRRHLKHVHGKE